MKKILVLGACGQIGTELVLTLRQLKGEETVVAADLKNECPEIINNGPYIQLDALDKQSIRSYIIDNNIKEVYLLAALLSATAEKNPEFAWKLNMEGLFILLDLAKEKHIDKIFWQSSIAVFGPTTPMDQTPQHTIMEPTTVYGISKQTGERWCEYYHQKFGVDVRSLRYPGLIGWKSEPGGGTTDYAVHIFHEALRSKKYESFLAEDTMLPMMYMPDALRATIGIMDAAADHIKIRSSYNVAAMSFTPKDIALEIEKHIPGFSISYKPDSRQQIADSWPRSFDDAAARKDWGWRHEFDLAKMTDDMLVHLQHPVM